jgi:hypothetical protein
MTVKDIRQKGFEVELDKKRTLMFDLNSFAEIEEKYGSFDDAIAQLEKGSVKALRTLLWAGLIHEDENLTEKQVGSMLDMTKMQEVSQTLVAAIGDNVPEAEPEEGNGKKK